jgi:hypothetical protein
MIKDFARLIFSDNRYRYEESSSIEMDRLALFLASDVGYFSPGWKEWALDQTSDFTTSNYASLQKEDGYILIGEEFAENLDAGPFFKISIEEFVKVLDQWEQFCKTRPKEILITRENGVIKMQGRD